MAAGGSGAVEVVAAPAVAVAVVAVAPPAVAGATGRPRRRR